ncbi:hypothetical protein CW751_06610 [Brumimicrobium salinarum]|uniref:Uncharacterized protein n=1 Tax=Brumimicrobium salinarum TaxID=2058658 RepID=A0A2I0R3U6_9FLAO|nr:hypothetical protein [Brumimicrobium salinarum]PKR81251.1 hypothetical protein CW751_06610 [Brumimicrobium salinarum]
MQETIIGKPKLIEKELVSSLKFNQKKKIHQQEDLMPSLLEATKLGNLHHGKVAIIFEDDEGLKQVETTIWSTGLKYICLKGGVWLPISSIHKVKIL